MQTARQPLVEALHNPDCYDHQADRIKLVETHISWIFLAGKFAYKLKKPVNFGFLDFSTLAKRKHFCQEELRLNRRFAPELYLDVVGIGGTPDAPRIGEQPIIDYLVKMRRFSRQDELDQLLLHACLTPDIIEQFADYIAKLHQLAPRIDNSQNYGSPESISAPAEENFSQLRPLLTVAKQLPQLDELESWNRTRFDELSRLMHDRKEHGMIRECHGDIHLANMLWYNRQPLLFDCIEFNDNFRCIDLYNDIAFLLMDLDDRQANSLSWSFLNRYLQQTGDYQGLRLLRYYQCYRAMVRAKVTALRLKQTGLSAQDREFAGQLLQSYLYLAESYTHKHKQALVITHGPSGAGKSTLVSQLAPACAAISIHSDIERKRLHGLPATAASGSGLDAGIYTPQASRATYDRLEELAGQIIKAGFSVIVDATFLARSQRTPFLRLAEALKVPSLILDFQLSESELVQRIEQRSKQRGVVSEADREVLTSQLRHAQPLSDEEIRHSIRLKTDSSVPELADQVKRYT